MSNMGNQWAYRRIDGPKPSCHQISQPGMSYRQHNRSERESLLRSRPYCLDILEWRESGICKSWKFPWDLGVVFRRSHQDEMLQFRKNCFPSTPSKAHQDSLAPWVCTFSAVISCAKSDGRRKKQKDGDRDRGCTAGLPGNFPAVGSPPHCFPIKSSLHVGSRLLKF